MAYTRVGVIRGGGGGEYDLSLATGGKVLQYLRERSQPAVDILITKDGQWHANGFPTTPGDVSKNIDVVFNALHGSFGERGTVQRILEHFSVPYTGSSPFASATAMHKGRAKEIFLSKGIHTPSSMLLEPDDNIAEVAFEISQTLTAPYVVKPATESSSQGVAIVTGLKDLIEAIEQASIHTPSVLVEEYIDGTEVTCGVIESGETDEYYATEPLGIVLSNGKRHLDYETKRAGEAVHSNFAALYPELAKHIQDIAVQAHKALGLRHYSRSDFIVGDGVVHILETNSLPALSDNAPFPHALKEAGLDIPEFVDYLLSLALTKK